MWKELVRVPGQVHIESRDQGSVFAGDFGFLAHKTEEFVIAGDGVLKLCGRVNAVTFMDNAVCEFSLTDTRSDQIEGERFGNRNFLESYLFGCDGRI